MLAWRAGDCLAGATRDRVAAEVLDRAVDAELVRAVLVWQAQEPARLDVDRLWRTWHRFSPWRGLEENLTATLAVCRDQRVNGWLVAMATHGASDAVRATAIDALAARGLSAVADVCRSELAFTTDNHRCQAAALLAAANSGIATAPTVSAWLERLHDDPEDPRVRAARCLRLAQDGTPSDLAWVRAAVALSRRYLSIVLVQDLCRTRLPGAIGPVTALLPLAIQGKGKPADSDLKRRLACFLSLLPADATVRSTWANQLGQPIPDLPMAEPPNGDAWGQKP